MLGQGESSCEEGEGERVRKKQTSGLREGHRERGASFKIFSLNNAEKWPFAREAKNEEKGVA